NSFETETKVYQTKVDSGTLTEEDYTKLLEERTETENRLSRLTFESPPECLESDIYGQKANDAMEQLGAHYNIKPPL
ncbi:hypothetical protein HYT51_02650, partial [Candidatus Woesearchaeota archaeon]|nr:hypothetical protein [Candidatus Woesearchaeota archaeon]